MIFKRPACLDSDRTRILTEIDLKTSQHVRYFSYDVPVAIGSGYPQVRSFNAFFHSRRPRKWRRWMYHEEEERVCWNHKREQMARMGVTKVETIWEFYALIGYNHRTNTFPK